jgi:cytosine/adenosine deaminase-related metal-dependent hydrolase
MGKRTCIRNADWVVAWDEENQRHTYLRQADVVFKDDAICFVGKGFAEPTDNEIDGADLCVMPGLIDIHSHPSTEPCNRGLREEHGIPEMYMSGLFERLQAFHVDPEGKAACAETAYCELLKSGVTSICDLSYPYPGWMELIAKSGLRGFMAPGYASSRWYLENRYQLKYHWDEEQARRDLDISLELIDHAGKHECGRLSGIIFPMQIDTCSEALLTDSVKIAKDRNLPIITHASQSVNEFLEMVNRYGKTPVQWAHDIGLLGPNCTLAHVVFIDEHSWLHWHTREDLRLLAETETTVAHCPTAFARYGQLMEHVGKYIKTGVNLGLGTDVSPHNLLEEMRWALVLGRVAAEDITAVQLADIFHAATIGGARSLQRTDIGKIARGCKADLVLIDLKNPWMQPARDPLRCLIFTAAERAVRDVFVDGIQVVKDHEVLTLDHKDALTRVTAAQQRMEEAAPDRDYAGRSGLEIAPLSLEISERI